ncbi:efflux RND transporter periplasmic adaptor subunit [Arundinibacter roseus]|uniref:HlyD family efflux transporter periplasmic adaptor subunit n=1 Tax=Arundinibacter roseus TaxID=2070510 RepID=A0A4R4KL57_9BACT|nr:HlyD family efflux transporter periplasmic adaptor subunit [Arundinibacter roseus]TDB67301.1 HlyD family efflux transporter periplasmic adaptor subunit [Arundinibacter roseus]
MDRQVAPELVAKEKRKKWLLGVGLLLVLAVALYFFRDSIRSTLELSRIRTGLVGRGTVENTLSATGEVVPAYEQIMISPIRASIKRVLLQPGAAIEPGMAILELDKSMTQLEVEKNEDQLELKKNSIEQLRLRLNKNLFDAEISDKIKLLNISKLKADLEDARRLQKVGGGTLEDITRAENALKIAELEKKQLENDLTYNRVSMSASLRETQLAAQIEEKNLRELQNKLHKADIIADRKGVITWVNETIGVSVNEGEMLARVADLGSFRVEGSCSDVHADQVKTGLGVLVKINDKTLRGLITQVKPAVKNGIIQFTIQLVQANSELLRPNMNVEVYIITSQSSQTLRVANGPAFTGKRKQYVFVRQGNKAIRREVEIGLSNFDFVEIKSGLKEGETVILSDLNLYEHLQEITLTN